MKMVQASERPFRGAARISTPQAAAFSASTPATIRTPTIQDAPCSGQQSCQHRDCDGLSQESRERRSHANTRTLSVERPAVLQGSVKIPVPRPQTTRLSVSWGLTLQRSATKRTRAIRSTDVARQLKDTTTAMKRTCHYFGSGLLKTLTSLQAPCLCFLDLGVLASYNAHIDV